MTAPVAARADSARAIALLQQIAALCDETMRAIPSHPERVEVLLETFEQTLCEMAPLFESLGRRPLELRDALLAAAHSATDQHQALVSHLADELHRLSEAIDEANSAARATDSYAGAAAGAPGSQFDTTG